MGGGPRCCRPHFHQVWGPLCSGTKAFNVKGKCSARICGHFVAQICNLPYGRFVIGRAPGVFEPVRMAAAQVANLRYVKQPPLKPWRRQGQAGLGVLSPACPFRVLIAQPCLVLITPRQHDYKRSKSAGDRGSGCAGWPRLDEELGDNAGEPTHEPEPEKPFHAD
jgi:hypothetical protein